MTTTSRAPGESPEGFDVALGSVLPDLDLPIGVSVAARAGVRSALAGRVLLEGPTVRGRTVWPTSGAGLAVVDSPNRYGCREISPNVPAVLVTEAGAHAPSWFSGPAMVRHGTRWTAHRSGSDAIDALAQSDIGIEYEARAAAARALAKRVTQLSGVHPAHGTPESPSFVVVTPGRTEAACAALADLQPAVFVDAVDAPGLPGCLRLTIGRNHDPADAARFTDRFSEAVIGRLARIEQ
jgi:hypothetical protein